MREINVVKLEMRDVSCAKNDKDERVGCNRSMKIYRRIMKKAPPEWTAGAFGRV